LTSASACKRRTGGRVRNVALRRNPSDSNSRTGGRIMRYEHRLLKELFLDPHGFVEMMLT
jgi:hypothetical protein